jgi:hypothetical protein
MKQIEAYRSSDAAGKFKRLSKKPKAEEDVEDPELWPVWPFEFCCAGIKCLHRANYYLDEARSTRFAEYGPGSMLDEYYGSVYYCPGTSGGDGVHDAVTAPFGQLIENINAVFRGEVEGIPAVPAVAYYRKCKVRFLDTAVPIIMATVSIADRKDGITLDTFTGKHVMQEVVLDCLRRARETRQDLIPSDFCIPLVIRATTIPIQHPCDLALTSYFASLELRQAYEGDEEEWGKFRLFVYDCEDGNVPETYTLVLPLKEDLDNKQKDIQFCLEDSGLFNVFRQWFGGGRFLVKTDDHLVSSAQVSGQPGQLWPVYFQKSCAKIDKSQGPTEWFHEECLMGLMNQPNNIAPHQYHPKCTSCGDQWL